MSSGCVVKKEERQRIVADAITNLAAALKILRKYPDPDKKPRELGMALEHVRRAIGPNYPNGPLRQPDGTLKYYEETDTRIGLDWLIEHYFS